MITKFDKSCATAMYKREFVEALDDLDYERACDLLLKFSENTDNPDFHMAFGMLYLLMSQDSEDRDFLTLAFREFMMYLRRHRDSERACRNILITLAFRQQIGQLLNWGAWMHAQGMDYEGIIAELEDFGLGILTGVDDGTDLEDFFDYSEYGAITAGVSRDGKSAEGEKNVETPKDAAYKTSNNQASNVIKFRGGQTETEKTARVERDNADIATFGGKVMSIADEEYDTFEGDDDSFPYDIESYIKAHDLTSASGEGSGGNSLSSAENKARATLARAEKYCEYGHYDKALDTLKSIPRSVGQLFYCGECMRAYIGLETNDIRIAEQAIENAYEVRPEGALVGTLYCRLCEVKDQPYKIPDALKRIDVRDFVDGNHVFRALEYAYKYCDPEDALDLAEDYIDEFNTKDLRLMYAQMLYNNGDKDDALNELYDLSRVLYDDFNARFYYISAKNDITEMPVGAELPQEVLGMMVGRIVSIAFGEKLTDEDLKQEAFVYGLETFLTLEFDNERKVTIIMFRAVREYAKDVRLRDKMRDTLVSPYVDPLVKAVILDELFASGERDFLIESHFSPISSDTLASFDEQMPRGFYTAYAFLAVFDASRIQKLVDIAPTVKDKTENAFSDEAIAGYLIRTLLGDDKAEYKRIEARIDYALGYKSKSAATKDYDAVSQAVGELPGKKKKKSKR